MIQTITTIAAIVVAALAIFEGKLWRENARLKKKLHSRNQKLRRRTLDCLALYEIEMRLSEACASCYALGSDSAAATKRNVRAAIREDGMQSPSEDCTPQRLSEDLQELEL